MRVLHPPTKFNSDQILYVVVGDALSTKTNPNHTNLDHKSAVCHLQVSFNEANVMKMFCVILPVIYVH